MQRDTVKGITNASKKASRDSGGGKTLTGPASEIHPGAKVENMLAMHEMGKT